EHFKFEDFAILYRTNAQSRIFEEALRKKNVPYKIYGGLSFYQRKEIKDILAYFRLVINPLDNEAFKRIVNYPARGIGDTTLNKLDQGALAAGVSIWDMACSLKTKNEIGLNSGTVNKLNLFTELIQGFIDKNEQTEAFDLASAIATGSGLLKDLYLDQSPEGLSKYENIQELLNGIQEFTINAREEGSANNLHDYLADVALLTDQDNEKPEDRDKVALMTVHSAKGLEFKVVFIVGVEDQLFPASYGGQPVTQQAMEEERRLFYVALTRAEKKAYLSFAKQRYQWGKLEFCKPSRFITEIDSRFLEATDSRMFSIFGRPEPSATVTQQQVQQRIQTASQPSMMRKLAGLKEAGMNATAFQGDDPSLLLPGMIVEHQRFGQGKILQLEGENQNMKATVFFQSAGQKQLLLKFAKLKIVK
ncbi:MAG: 3'-5' exonuclease, partial [Bacteroidota bacterium]|nr:3'-5' exonuclease [Bacteroidota bacterium]